MRRIRRFPAAGFSRTLTSMKRHFNHLVPAVAISAAVISCAQAFNFFKTDPLDAKATDAATTVLTTKLLERSQIAHQQLDEKLAGKFLDRYLDTLDGNHMIFLQSDLAEFAKYRPTLAEATRKQGDSSLAHVIFKRFLERLDQRVAYIAGMLKEGNFEFTADETFAYDRAKAPHPADLTAAKTLWKQQFRYEYLQEKLSGKKEPEIAKILGRRSSRIAETMRKLDASGVLELFLESLAQVYDPHSDYMGKEQMQSFEIA